jgi:hypothetical protein
MRTAFGDAWAFASFAVLCAIAPVVAKNNAATSAVIIFPGGVSCVQDHLPCCPVNATQ